MESSQRESQNTIVLKHLIMNKKFGITSWEAIERYHITRLASRIFDLKAKGNKIDSVREDDHQTKKHWNRYTLILS